MIMHVHNKKKVFILKVVNAIIELFYLPGKIFAKKPELLNLSPKKILLIRIDHIGDVVMTSPAFTVIRTRFPDAEIILLTDSVGKQLFEKDPRLNKVIAFNWPWVHQKKNNRFTYKKLKELYKLVVMLRQERIDIMVDFRGDLRFVVLFGITIGAKTRVSNSRCGQSSLLQHISFYDVSKHEVNRSLDVVRCFGKLDGESKTQVFLEHQEIDSIKRKIESITGNSFSSRLVIIAPYSSKDVKSWPVSYFREVIQYLGGNGYDVIVVGTPDDEEDSKRMIKGISGSVYSFAGRTSICELAALVSVSQLVVGVDTGVLHIASCFPVPIIAIFGSTRSVEFRPYSNLAIVLETKTCKCNQFLHDKCDFSKEGYASCLIEVKPVSVIKTINDIFPKNPLIIDEYRMPNL